MLGTEGTLGEMLGLDKEWAKRAIMARGNYGEIFAKNIGESTPIGLDARPERAVDRRRPALRTAVPLSRNRHEGRGRARAPFPGPAENHRQDHKTARGASGAGKIHRAEDGETRLWRRLPTLRRSRSGCRC